MPLLRLQFTILFFASLVAFPVERLFAHSTGASFEEEKGGYFVDIGYSPENLQDGDTLALDFNLFQGAEEQASAVPFDSVWLQISDENQTYFAGAIAQSDLGITRVSYAPPHAGTYTISARFQHNGNSLVESEFPIAVDSDSEQKTPIILTALFAAAVVVLGVGVWSMKIRKNIST